MPAHAPSTAPRPPLQADLVAMLEATRKVERDLFAMLKPSLRQVGGTIGEWSAKDVRAHLAAWRAIEARRLEAAVGGDGGVRDDDPRSNDPVDQSNAMLHARAFNWSWDAVAVDAEASLAALLAAIDRSSSEILCECDGTTAGIGANGVNHAIGHLPEIAVLAGGLHRFDAYVREVEAILLRGHLPPRDSGVMLYNVACHFALTDELDEARRLLRLALARRHDLLEFAGEDPDLVALREEVGALA